MEFLGNSPLLACHARFDQRMLTWALQKGLGYRLRHRFFDTAELAPMLYPDAPLIRPGLDDWVKHFALQVQQRHHASADVLVTAKLALILSVRCVARASRPSLIFIWRCRQAAPR